MKIIRLETEGVKRLHAVAITPAGNVVEVTGKNGEGKTSTLDSIWYAIAGTSNIPAQPIHKGVEAARIRLDLGEIIVTRRFKRKGENEFTTDIKVEGADGSSYKSPQAMLDALLPSLSFDPLEFSRMKPRQQFDALRAFVPDIDFQKIEDQNRGDFERRTEANRRTADAKAAAGMIALRDDLPEEEINESELMDKMTAAGQHNANIERENEHRQQRAADIATARNKASEYRAGAEACRKKAEELDQAAVRLESQIADDVASLESAGALGKPIDVMEVRQTLLKAQATNAAIRQLAEATRRKASLEKVATDAALLSDELTAKIEARNRAKQAAIANAQMPVPGLGFGNGFITLNDLPFDQASSAEQLKASIGIAMRSNSKLRVILIRDGSLLDADSFAMVTKMADENDCSVWIESVFAHSNQAVVIQDGRLGDINEKGAQDTAA